MQYWFFGIPGSGKSHLAKIFAEIAKVEIYEGDDFHTEEDRTLVAKGEFTVRHRHAQLKRIRQALDHGNTSSAVITHPLPDRESRRILREQGAQLIWIEASITLVMERLKKRKGHHFTADMLEEWIPRLWEDPESENLYVVYNDEFANIEQQLQDLWHQFM